MKIQKNAIMNAFKELYKEKEFDKISVSSICSLANINRGTFYYYYKDIYDLFSYMENYVIGLIKEIYPLIVEIIIDKNPENMDLILRFFKKHKDIIILFIEKRDNKTVQHEMKKVALQCLKEKLDYSVPEYSDKANGVLEYIASGQIGLMTWWVRNGKSIPVNDFFELIYSINNNGAFKTLLNLK
ncbi:MAG: TetR/AcrR family transcriptional regulator [Clostridiales bacterium]|nr:TetR/AcrR family transcriptional regulator [Clostridiales bacterium]